MTDTDTTCANCQAPIPPTLRADARYCGNRCKKRSERKRWRRERRVCFDIRFNPTATDVRPQDVGRYHAALTSDPCAYCGQRSSTIDHIDGSRQGGENAWPNFTASCRECNSAKAARPLLGYLLSRKLWSESMTLAPRGLRHKHKAMPALRRHRRERSAASTTTGGTSNGARAGTAGLGVSGSLRLRDLA